MSTGIPKAVLYYYPASIWSASGVYLPPFNVPAILTIRFLVLLALEEKGYAPEEYDLKIVDLGE